MSDAYIEQRDDVCVVAGTRVSLDSIVYAFLSGHSAEAIAQAFSVLSLEQVFLFEVRQFLNDLRQCHAVRDKADAVRDGDAKAADRRPAGENIRTLRDATERICHGSPLSASVCTGRGRTACQPIHNIDARVSESWNILQPRALIPGIDPLSTKVVMPGASSVASIAEVTPRSWIRSWVTW